MMAGEPMNWLFSLKPRDLLGMLVVATMLLLATLL